MKFDKFGSNRLDLNALELFVTVAEVSSFAVAARKLGIPKWSVSRYVSSLEATMGVPLLHRTTRSISLSPAGVALYERVAPLLSSINRVAGEFPETMGEPAGEVRISAPVDIGSAFLSEAVSQFTQRYRAVRVDVSLTAHMDVVIKGFDIALRTGPHWMKDSSLIVKSACSVVGQIFASPAYLERCGTPTEPIELEQHEWVVLSNGNILPLVGPGGEAVTLRPQGRICSDDLSFARYAVRSGSGLGILPTYMVKADIDSGRLVRVLPDYSLEETRLYIVRPYTREVPRRVKLLIEFLCEYLKEHPLADSAH